MVLEQCAASASSTIRLETPSIVGKGVGLFLLILSISEAVTHPFCVWVCQANPGHAGIAKEDCSGKPFVKWISGLLILINFDPLCSF